MFRSNFYFGFIYFKAFSSKKGVLALFVDIKQAYDTPTDQTSLQKVENILETQFQKLHPGAVLEGNH